MENKILDLPQNDRIYTNFNYDIHQLEYFNRFKDVLDDFLLWKIDDFSELVMNWFINEIKIIAFRLDKTKVILEIEKLRNLIIIFKASTGDAKQTAYQEVIEHIFEINNQINSRAHTWTYQLMMNELNKTFEKYILEIFNAELSPEIIIERNFSESLKQKNELIHLLSFEQEQNFIDVVESYKAGLALSYLWWKRMRRHENIKEKVLLLQEYPFLSNYTSMFEKYFRNKNIMWIWTKWIVLSLDKDRVVKLPITWFNAKEMYAEVLEHKKRIDAIHRGSKVNTKIDFNKDSAIVYHPWTKGKQIWYEHVYDSHLKSYIKKKYNYRKKNIDSSDVRMNAKRSNRNFFWCVNELFNVPDILDFHSVDGKGKYPYIVMWKVKWNSATNLLFSQCIEHNKSLVLWLKSDHKLENHYRHKYWLSNEAFLKKVIDYYNSHINVWNKVSHFYEINFLDVLEHLCDKTPMRYFWTKLAFKYMEDYERLIHDDPHPSNLMIWNKSHSYPIWAIDFDLVNRKMW